MSNNMIAVWGAPGRGKTTVAVNLAAALAKENTVLLVSCNLWFPEIQMPFGQVVKESGSISRLAVASCAPYDLFTQVHDLKNLQLLTLPDDHGQLFGDYWNGETAAQLYAQIDRCAFNYVIVDGASQPDNPISTLGLERAALLLHVGGFGVSGLFWQRAMQPLREGLRLDAKTTYAANRFDGPLYSHIEPELTLPEVEDMERFPAQGKTAFGSGPKKYARAIGKLAEIVQKEAALR